MPTYTYQCRKCGHFQDVFHAMSANPRVKCEQCGASCKRLLGTGAGIIFKGSGFYETDYKKNGRTAVTSDGAEKSDPTAASGATAKTEGKSESSGSKGKTGGTDSTKAA